MPELKREIDQRPHSRALLSPTMRSAREEPLCDDPRTVILPSQWWSPLRAYTRALFLRRRRRVSACLRGRRLLGGTQFRVKLKFTCFTEASTSLRGAQRQYLYVCDSKASKLSTNEPHLAAFHGVFDGLEAPAGNDEVVGRWRAGLNEFLPRGLDWSWAVIVQF